LKAKVARWLHSLSSPEKCRIRKVRSENRTITIGDPKQSRPQGKQSSGTRENEKGETLKNSTSLNNRNLNVPGNYGYQENGMGTPSARRGSHQCF